MKQTKLNLLATLLTMAALFAGQQAWAETVTYAIDGHTETNSTGTTTMTIYASGSVTGSVTDQWNYTTTQTRTVNLPGGITFSFGSDKTSSLFFQSTALAIGATANNGGYITLTHGSKYIYHVTLRDRGNNVVHEAWNMTKSYTYNFHEIVIKSIEVEYATAIPITDAVISGINDSYYVSNAAVTPTPTVTWHGTTLSKNTHYIVDYQHNTTAGTATVTATGKDIFSTNTSVSKNYTLVWTTYTVHFDKNNDNASGTMSDQGFYYTEQKALTANGFSRMGYTFDGWSTTPNGAVEYTDSQSVSNLTAQNGATVNLYAQWTVADFETGHEGTEEDPYIIYNDDQLNMLAERVNTINNYSWHKYFKLGADITYDGTENNYTPIGIVATIMAAFQGTFDGDDHSISGIHINNNSDNQGLFGYVYNGTVKNVILRSSTITGIDNIGGIVGRLEYGTVTDCRVESTVTIGANGDGDNVAMKHGGIVGYLYLSTVNGCISAATVTQSGIVGYRFGGIAGRIYGNTATISNCLALGATVVVNVYPSIRGGAILGSEDGGNLVHNYYHDCTVGSASTNIGTNNGDIEQDDGAVQVFSLTLGEGITATPAPAVTYNNINYYTAGTEITLGAPQGYAITSATLTYGGNDHSIEGNSFEMPAQDVAVTAVLQAPYTFDSSTGALTLNWGEFNMDNKWGDDVNRLAVTSVTATDEVSFTGDCYKLFYGFEHCTSMDLSNVNTDGLTNISCMFWGCWSLNTLDLSSWNTAAVTAMTSAFRGCQGLTSLNLTGWNTASVTTMGHLFLECYNLATIEGISEWVPESVTNMTEMFSGCSNLQSLDLSGWNTANVTTMLEMFIGCSSLQSLDLSGWNTAKVNNMSSMFYGCSSLQSLDLSGWNTSNVWYMYGMFDGCSSLTTIYVGEGWNTSHVIDSDYMFDGCTSLVGGMGTTYDADHTDAEYARIDRGPNSDQPGYFTGAYAPAGLVESIVVNPDEIYPTVGATYSIVFTVLPADATNKAVTFSTDDETVATADENGTVTAVAAGTATITIAATDGSGVTGTLTVNVMNIDVEEITVYNEYITISTGGTATINYQVLPEQATDASVTFTSANTAIATVDADGVVTGVGMGVTTITIASVQNPEVTATVEVTVGLNPFGAQFTKGITGYGNDENLGGWYLIASPLAGSTPVTDVTNLTSNTYDLYRFNQAASGAEWQNYKAHNGDAENPFNALVSGQGYLYANSNNVPITFVGTPNSDDVEVILVKDDNAALPGWNLVGNPFTVNTYIELPFYIMNEAGSEIIAANGARDHIEPMEGIFVYAEDDGESLIFTANAPSKGRGQTPAPQQVVINLSTLNSQLSTSIIDRAIVRFDEGRQLPKLQIFENSPKLYIPQGGKDYAVVSVGNVGEMPLNFKAKENGEYTLTVSAPLTSNLSTLTLIDNLIGTNIDLLTNPFYTFTARNDDYASRFKLVFNAQQGGAEADFAFISNGEIIVTGEGVLQVIDVMGRVIVSVDGRTRCVPTDGMAPGVYVLRLINGENVKTQKIIIK